MNFQSDNNSQPAGNQHSITASGLECIRNDLTLFSNLEITVNAGEILQVDGANGSGKTSLLRIICGLAQPHAGNVFWNGSDINTLGADYLKEINYVGHNNGIKSELTPLENLNIAMALKTETNNFTPLNVLEHMGIITLKDTPVAKLSSGQRRRVALARLLISQTSLWILDEPFTALDETGKDLVQKMIENHTENLGIVIVVTHENLRISENKIKKINL